MKMMHLIRKGFSLLGFTCNVIGSTALLIVIGHVLIGMVVDDQHTDFGAPDNEANLQTVSGDPLALLPV